MKSFSDYVAEIGQYEVKKTAVVPQEIKEVVGKPIEMFTRDTKEALAEMRALYIIKRLSEKMRKKSE